MSSLFAHGKMKFPLFRYSFFAIPFVRFGEGGIQGVRLRGPGVLECCGNYDKTQKTPCKVSPARGYDKIACCVLQYFAFVCLFVTRSLRRQCPLTC